jgi:CrcB protein
LKGIEILFLAIGAVVGAFLRYRLTETPTVLGGLSVNVLVVNILGSFVLGTFSVLSFGLNLDIKYILLIAIGFCSSFTTMSAFILETSNLIEMNRFNLVILNIIANVGLSLGALVTGRVLGKIIMEKIL